MNKSWDNSEFSRRANWEEIRKLANKNVFVGAALKLQEDGKLSDEETLMLMVLLQDDVLRNIEKLQADGYKYGE